MGFHKKLINDTTELNRTEVNPSIEELETLDLLVEKTANSLKGSQAKIPKFKMFPKIHKEGNLGRSVVSSVDFQTTTISKYISFVYNTKYKILFILSFIIVL